MAERFEEFVHARPERPQGRSTSIAPMVMASGRRRSRTTASSSPRSTPRVMQQRRAPARNSCSPCGVGHRSARCRSSARHPSSRSGSRSVDERRSPNPHGPRWRFEPRPADAGRAVLRSLQHGRHHLGRPAATAWSIKAAVGAATAVSPSAGGSRASRPICLRELPSPSPPIASSSISASAPKRCTSASASRQCF